MDPTLDGQQSLAYTSVSEQTLQPTWVLEHVQRASTGAAVLFVGLVRDHDGGRGVNWLEYSSHPSADDVLREVTAGNPRRPSAASAGTLGPPSDRKARHRRRRPRGCHGGFTAPPRSGHVVPGGAGQGPHPYLETPSLHRPARRSRSRKAP